MTYAWQSAARPIIIPCSAAALPAWEFFVPISVTCAKCGHTLSVKDKYAGKKGLCPQCQNAIHIPGPDDELKMAPLAKPQAAEPTASKTVSVATAATVQAPPAAAPKPLAKKKPQPRPTLS